jgi:hypothetical protein
MKFRPEGRSANKDTPMPVDEKRSDDDTRAGSTRADDIAEAELITDALAEPLPGVSPPPPPARRGGGAFLGTVLGGILAAAAGFGLARVVPGGWPLQDSSALEAQIKAQADTLAALTAQLADLSARPVGTVSDDLAALKADLEQRLADAPAAIDPAPLIAGATQKIEATIAALDTRLTEIELRPVGTGGAASSAALAAYDRQLQELRAQIAAQSGQGSDVAAQIEAVAAEALEESFFSQTCKRRAEDVVGDGVREREVGGGSGRYAQFTGFTGDVLMRHELREPDAPYSRG